jgi:hypothetical protein
MSISHQLTGQEKIKKKKKKMELKCIVPECNKKNVHRKTFQFPLAKEYLLKQWIQELKTAGIEEFIVTQETRICEDHFPDVYKIYGSPGICTGLLENAVPTQFESRELQSIKTSNSCRFCLVKFDGIPRVEINKEIEQDFKILTQMDLNHNESYSQEICLSCHKHLKLSSKFKSKLIANQIKFFGGSPAEDVKLESDDLHFERVEVKIEEESDSEEKRAGFPEALLNSLEQSDDDVPIEDPALKEESIVKKKGRKLVSKYDREWKHEK